MLKENVKLWKHQDTLVNSALEHGKYNLWYSGCGTGKTLASIALVDKLNADRVLVLTNKSAVKSVWEKEINYWVSDTIKIVAPIGVTSKRTKEIRSIIDYEGKLFIVLNYEYAWRIASVLEALQFDIVIADESHKLQSYKSKVSTVLANTCRDIPYKLAMTGTVMEDKVSQLYGQVRFLDSTVKRNRPISKLFGFYNNFRNKYEITKPLANGVRIVVGHKNLEYLFESIAPFTVNLDSDEVLDLPDYQDIYREIDLDKKTRKYYNDMLRHKVADVDGNKIIADNIVVQLTRLYQISLGHYTNSVLLEPLLELLEEIGEKPIVIFVHFRRDVKIIADAIKYPVSMITGEVNEYESWVKGNTNIAIVNVGAGSESIDLSRASYAIYYSKNFSRTKYVQSRYRLRRPPATDRIVYYHLTVKDTIGELIDKALVAKGKVVDYLIEYLKEYYNG